MYHNTLSGSEDGYEALISQRGKTKCTTACNEEREEHAQDAYMCKITHVPAADT